jgi:transposase
MGLRQNVKLITTTGSANRLHFNPIEKAFSRLKAMLRKAGERTVSGLWNLIGRLVEIFQPDECANYFKSCGYEPD